MDSYLNDYRRTVDYDIFNKEECSRFLEQLSVVREAEEGETLTTLDGNVRTLKPGMLVIADENKPIGLAGIMGGENSEIQDDTTTVVFESANFNGTSIRQTALALGMRTDASGKFEKHIDPMMTMPAVQRACELVELLGLEPHKAVILSVVREDMVDAVMNTLEDKFATIRNGKGISFAVPLSSVIGVNLYQFLSNNRTLKKEDKTDD